VGRFGEGLVWSAFCLPSRRFAFFVGEFIGQEAISVLSAHSGIVAETRQQEKRQLPQAVGGQH
jgi:hypothetical protein